MASSPFTPPASSVEVVSRLNESDYVKAFLAYLICSLLGGFLGGSAIGAVVGGVWGFTGAATNTFAFTATIIPISAITALLVYYVVFRFFVNRFIVQKLLAHTDGAA